jgi:hypothetical protein
LHSAEPSAARWPPRRDGKAHDLKTRTPAPSEAGVMLAKIADRGEAGLPAAGRPLRVVMHASDELAPLRRKAPESIVLDIGSRTTLEIIVFAPSRKPAATFRGDVLEIIPDVHDEA